MFVRASYLAIGLVVWSAVADAQVAPVPAPATAAAVGQAEPVAAPASATPAIKIGAAPVSEATEPAKPVAPPKPAATLFAKVDLTSQRLTVVANGATLHTWPISSGAYGYNTPVGTFTPGWKAKLWLSKQYDDAPMPHAVFFKDGAAIHATQAVGSLGRPASHGCVRLAPANAATFYALVGKHGLQQTRVIVSGTPKHVAPAIARNQQVRPQVQQVAYVNAYRGYGAPGGYSGYGQNSGLGGGGLFGSWGQPQPQQIVYVSPAQMQRRAVVQQRSAHNATVFARPRAVGYVPVKYRPL